MIPKRARLTAAFVLALTGVPAVGCGGRTQDTWVDRTKGTAANRWTGVASNATGVRLVAVGGAPDGGDVWTSADSGATWINRTKGTPASGLPWADVASDASGEHLVVVTGWGGTSSTREVWTSADAGATWNRRMTVTPTADLESGPAVASDVTGTHLVLADGDIWTSADSGATWIDQTTSAHVPEQDWVGIASSATGARLVAITAYSDIWTSADSGATWTNRTRGTAASGQQWAAVASDATGTDLVAISGDIWTSSDAGATWSNRTAGTAASGHNWVSVVSNATGDRIFAATAHESPSAHLDDLWGSNDSGATWFDATEGTVAASQSWVALASDATVTHLVGITDGAGTSGVCCNGDIWTD